MLDLQSWLIGDSKIIPPLQVFYYHYNTMAVQQRDEVNQGMLVDIVLKADQSTGNLTRGIVQDILTSSAHHPRGIKVRLESGEVGRVEQIAEQ